MGYEEEMAKQLKWWNELLAKIVYQKFPLLPWPELPQDQAYVAAVIDDLMRRANRE